MFARHLGFTHAAAELHLSQPALHAQIGRLSEGVAATLYLREGRRLALTEQGRQTLTFARELLGRSRRFLDELHTGSDQQPVVLAAGEGAFLYLLGRPIRRFLARDRVPLTLLTRDSAGCLDALRGGVADVAVTAGEGTQHGLQSQLLCRVPMVVAMPHGYPLARWETLSLGRLESAGLIVPPLGAPLRTTIEQAMGAAGVPWEVAVETSGWPLMLHCAGRWTGHRQRLLRAARRPGRPSPGGLAVGGLPGPSAQWAGFAGVGDGTGRAGRGDD